MIPARDRQLRLTIYNTQADMEADTNGTNITSGIYESSANLEHTFFTVLPGWGEANASMFTCDLADAPDLTGKYIRVWVLAYATEAATTRTSYRVFAGRIDSCRYDKYKASRALEAYDRLYELRKVDISEWWNTWVQSQTASTFTLAAALNAMCTQYGVTNNASLPGYGTGTAPMKARKLGACSFVQMLGYIGEICGGYFSMQDGTLRFVDMRNVNGTAAQESADGNLDTQLTEIDDADTAPYTQVTIYEGSDIVYSNGSGKNLAITDNPFLTGQTPATINSWGDNIYANVTRMAGRPATLALAYSQPQAEWSRITSAVPFILTTTDEGTTRRHIVSGYSFSGSGLIDETISCTGEMREGASYSAQQNAMLSELTDLGTQLTFKVNADAVIEAVNLEAQGGVTINAEAIDINGVVSANNGFRINADGSMETIAGKIAEWIIEQTRLYKTRGDVTVELYAGDSTHSPRVRVYGAGKYVEMGNGAFVSTENYNGSTNVAEGTVVVNGRELTLTRSDWEEHATWSDWVQTFLTSLKDSKLTLKHWVWNDETTQYDEIETYVDYNGIHAANEVYAKGRNLLAEFKAHTQYFATEIPANSNLKTTAYLNAGRYVCKQNATAATLSNCPVSTAFNLDVDYPISTFNTLQSTWAYIQRTITAISGEVWFQYVYLDGNGNLTWYDWTPLRSGAANGNVVRQIETTENSIYEILFSESTQDGVSHFERARKYQGLRFNPSNAQFNVRRIHSGTTSQIGSIVLGNATGNGSQGASHGSIYVYGKGTKYARFADENSLLTADRLYELPNKDGVLAILEDDTLDAGNRGIQITGADVGRSVSIRTKAGGIAYFTYFANGNHGVYSSGYESDIADSSTYTASNKWIIRRNSGGNVFIDEWASIGSAGRPVYISSSGRPVAVTETTGSGTRNTTTTTGGTCSYVKQGKIVSVTAYGVALRAGVVDGNNLFTGLPAAAAEHHVGFPCVNAGSQTDYTGIEAYVDTSGNLKFKRGGTLNGKYYAASFTYFAAS